MISIGCFPVLCRRLTILPALMLAAMPCSARVQAPSAKTAPPAAKAKEPAGPYTIELLEKRMRIENDGTSRQEAHAVVLISGESAVAQFGRLSFDYDRSRESLEIPFLRITHPGGGTADILPGAITDQANPAIADSPAFAGIRRKSVRILGLRPGDRLEYRVVKTVRRAELAPEFSFSHTFTRSGIVAREIVELDLPAARAVQFRASPSVPAPRTEESGQGEGARKIYRWDLTNAPGSGDKGEAELLVTSFASWEQLSARFARVFFPEAADSAVVRGKCEELLRGAQSGDEKLRALYDFVARKIRTVVLPPGTAGFTPRGLEAILSSGYGTAEEKAVLLAALARLAGLSAHAVLMTDSEAAEKELLPSSLVISRVLVKEGEGAAARWLDPGAEVAPLGMIHSSLRGKQGLVVYGHPDGSQALWATVPLNLPFAARQQVRVEATLGEDGQLSAKVHYALRGDTELLLRAAFHQTPKEKWSELAQMLALSDGFRGKITGITASDPLETREPFTFEYEIAQQKFLDWSKSPVQIPALLPQAGLPDLPPKEAGGAAIELGTPLEVETASVIHLPSSAAFAEKAWSVRKPLGMTVTRDYAAFSSQYAVSEAPAGTPGGRTLTSSRHLTFLLRKIGADRAVDYAAFQHAVQNDDAQRFTLEKAASGSAGVSPEAKKPASRNRGAAAHPAQP